MSGDIAALNGGQPVTTTEENTGGRDFEPMPAGWYPVEAVKAEIKDTRDKKGKYLWIEVTVIGERYAGRKLFPRFNILNASAEAQKIGQRDLAFLGQAIGLPTGVKDSQEILGKQFDARIKIRPASGDYPAANEVTAYEALGKMSSKAQATAPKASGAKPAAGQPRAWDKPPAGNAPAAPAPAASTPAPTTTPASTGAPPATPSATAAPSAPSPAPTVTPSKRPWERK